MVIEPLEASDAGGSYRPHQPYRMPSPPCRQSGTREDGYRSKRVSDATLDQETPSDQRMPLPDVRVRDPRSGTADHHQGNAEPERE
jgi:hypothetical protein